MADLIIIAASLALATIAACLIAWRDERTHDLEAWTDDIWPMPGDSPARSGTEAWIDHHLHARLGGQ